MKKRFVYGILAALAVCSCQVEEIYETTPESIPEVIREAKVFTAIIDDTTTPETKTSLDVEGNVLWKQGDQVSIFAESTVNEQYQVTDASDGKTAASLNKVGDSGFVAGTEIDNNVAFYPYASTAAIAKSAGSYVISDITLPATQTYAEGSFGNGAFPMAAVTGSTGDMNLKFKNVLGGLKLQLKGTASIASISITGNNNEILCGAAEVTVSNGSTPSINLTDISAKTVTLDCGAGVALNSETATPFIIALPPITMTGGFIVVVTDTEGKQMEIKTTKSQTIARSSLLKMPAVNYVGISPIVVPAGAVDLGLSVMWASCNLCDSGFANSPTEFGDYYQWGETEATTSSHVNKWIDLSKMTVYYSKYVSFSQREYGNYDGKTVLDDQDDAAHVILGGNWRIPTKSEWSELLENCTKSNTTIDEIQGMLFTGPNGNSIFMPFAWQFGSDYNARPYYWSSSLYTEGSNPNYAHYTDFNFASLSRTDRGNAYSIRPVAD